MRLVGVLSVFILCISLPTRVRCEFSLRSILNSLGSAVRSVSYTGIKCRYWECCNEDYIHYDLTKLNGMLAKELYGQEIAHNTVINALRGHIYSSDPPKALSMSFHGTPGTGKNYVARMIAQAFYKKGTDSEFYHYFNGRNDFPLEREVETYKEKLRTTIEDSLAKCERSMFVFDEVDKMPAGLLNVLVPFLDYNPWHKSWRYSNSSPKPKQRAVYIFLSNTGSTQIVKRMLGLWLDGRQRENTQLQDFENLIALGAFNEKGGFHHSDAIESSVIDHYVPFLPLEEKHVQLCLKKAFLERNTTPTDEMLREAMSHVTFGPPPHNIYSSAGCKRLEQKVASIVYSKKKRKTEL